MAVAGCGVDRQLEQIFLEELAAAELGRMESGVELGVARIGAQRAVGVEGRMGSIELALLAALVSASLVEEHTLAVAAELVSAEEPVFGLAAAVGISWQRQISWQQFEPLVSFVSLASTKLVSSR
jgi:hypothetical protein